MFRTNISVFANDDETGEPRWAKDVLAELSDGNWAEVNGWIEVMLPVRKELIYVRFRLSDLIKEVMQEPSP